MATLLIAAFILPLPKPAYAAPAYTLEERAQAIAEPAVIFTELMVEGIVRDKATAKQLSDKPIVVSVRCSGVVVNPAGSVLSTRFCAAPTVYRVARWAFTIYAEQLVAGGKLAQAQQQAFVEQLDKTAEFVADNGGGEPLRRIFAQTGDATVGLTAAPAISGHTPEPSDDPDVGLMIVQFSQGDLPSIEVGEVTGLNSGATGAALGYGPSGRVYALAGSPVRISGIEGDYQPPWYHLEGKLPTESRGGAFLDSSGRLAGMLLWNSSVNDTIAIAAALTDAGVSNQISETDRLYRQAVDDYFAGRYAAAIKKFDQVKAASPANASAAKYRALAASRQAIEGGSDAGAGIPTWLIIALSAVGGALIAVLVALLIRLRRPRVVNQTENLVPISVNPFAPISGAGSHPVSGSGYSAFPTGGYPVVTPGTEVAEHPRHLEIPEAAPPGVPVPHPPVQRPPIQVDADIRPERTPPTAAAGVTSLQEDDQSGPAEGTEAAERPQLFRWPEDEESGHDVPSANPWAVRPPPHS